MPEGEDERLALGAQPAWPFGRGVYFWGEPIAIPGELDDSGLESARRLVETRMVEMVGEGRCACPIAPISCAPAAR